MKSLTLFALAIFCLAGAGHAQQKKEFSLTGRIIGKDTGAIVLHYSYVYTAINDTARIENGMFHFKGHVEDVALASVRSSDYRVWNELMLENSDSMQLFINMVSPRDSFRVTGSPANDDYTYLQSKLKPMQAKAMELWTQLEKLKKTDSALAKKRYKEELQPMYDFTPRTIQEFVRDHPASLLSLFFVGNFQNMMPAPEVKARFEKLDPALQHSDLGQRVAAAIDGKLKAVEGTRAMAFTLKDTNGKPVQLDVFRKNKYVLVDFWASWCGPCREESPNLVKAYAKYGGKDFDILGVSLDSDLKYWKEAIAKDQLTWTNVCDVKDVKNKISTKYGVTQIPSNFLLDHDGNIIARNLRGKDLEKKLSDIFGQ